MSNDLQPNKKKRRFTDAEIENATDVVYEMILNGYSSREIKRYLSERYDISDRTGDRYIQRASDKIKEEGAKKRESSLEKHIVRRERLYQKAIKNGDSKLALQILGDLAKVEGIYTDGSTVNIESKEKKLKISFKSTEEIKKELESKKS